VKDFPPQRESVNVWCLSCPPLVVSREQERRTIRKLERWNARWLSTQDEMGYLYSVKRCTAIVIGVLSTPAHPLKCIASITVHHASIIQTVKQTDQLKKRYTEDVPTVHQSTCVTDLSMCIQHIINPVQHQKETDQQSKRLAAA
jgi:hypothetical protein